VPLKTYFIFVEGEGEGLDPNPNRPNQTQIGVKTTGLLWLSLGKGQVKA